MLKTVQLILCIILVLSGFFVAFLESPIESVMFLILSFCIAGALLFIYNVDFLGLLYIIIYVGAVAVLFLFVIMMLELKFNTDVGNRKGYLLKIVMNAFILIFTLICCYNYFTSESLINFFFISRLFSFEENFFFDVLDIFYNIDCFGQVLYNYFLLAVVVSGIALLVALVGAIVLTHKFVVNQKKQLVYRQIARTSNISFFF